MYVYLENECTSFEGIQAGAYKNNFVPHYLTSSSVKFMSQVARKDFNSYL